MSPDERKRYLTVYLNDHLAGATAGAARFERAARAHRGTEVGRVLEELHAEVVDDRRSLIRFFEALSVPRRRSTVWAGRAVEAVGALKPNGRLVRTSPLRTVVELEGLLLGVEGKAAGWRSLLELADQHRHLDAEVLGMLIVRAERQSSRLEELRRTAVSEVLGASPVRRAGHVNRS